MKKNTYFLAGLSSLLLLGGHRYWQSVSHSISASATAPVQADVSSPHQEISALMGPAQKSLQTGLIEDKHLIALPDQIENPDSLQVALAGARHAIVALDEKEKNAPENEGVSHFAFNPGQGLVARFSQDGVRFQHPHDETWQATFHAAEFAHHEGSNSTISNESNRLTYQRGAIDEWFLNAEEGVEQGWTIHRPLASETISLTIPVSGLTPVEEADGIVLQNELGQDILRYQKLLAYDAKNHSLVSSMRPSDGGIAITVEAAGASYPVTIDPLILSAYQELRPEVSGLLPFQSSFGQTVHEVHGNVLIVDGLGRAIYVFRQDLGIWRIQQRLGLRVARGRIPVATSDRDQVVVDSGDGRHSQILFWDDQLMKYSSVFLSAPRLPFRNPQHKTMMRYDAKERVLVVYGGDARRALYLSIFRLEGEGEDLSWSRPRRPEMISYQGLLQPIGNVLELDRSKNRIFLGQVPDLVRNLEGEGKVLAYSYEKEGELELLETITSPNPEHRTSFGSLIEGGTRRVDIFGGNLERDTGQVATKYSISTSNFEFVGRPQRFQEIGAEPRWIIDDLRAEGGGSSYYLARIQDGDSFLRGVVVRPGGNAARSFVPFPKNLQLATATIGWRLYLALPTGGSSSPFELSVYQFPNLPGHDEPRQISLSFSPSNSGYGDGLALDGSRLVIGASGMPNPVINTRGRLWFMTEQHGGWDLEQEFRNGRDVQGRSFGGSLALEGDTLLLASYSDETAVDILTRSERGWDYEASLLRPETETARWITHLSLSQNRALVTWEDWQGFPIGEIPYYEKGESGWSLRQTFTELRPLPTRRRSWFGRKAVFAGDEIVISRLHSEWPDRESDGYVAVYQKNESGVWENSQILEGEGLEEFADDLVGDGRFLAIASRESARRDVGQIDCYRKSDDQWNLTQTVASSGPAGLAVWQEILAVASEDKVTLFQPWSRAGGEIQGEFIFEPGQVSGTSSLVMDRGLLAVNVREDRTDQLGDIVSNVGAVRTFTLSRGTELEAWRARYFEQIENEGVSADTADGNDDGVSNLTAYALGLDPTMDNKGAVAEFLPVLARNDGSLFLAIKNPPSHRPNLNYQVESSPDLETWTRRLSLSPRNDSWTGDLGQAGFFRRIQAEDQVEVDLSGEGPGLFYRLNITSY